MKSRSLVLRLIVAPAICAAAFFAVSLFSNAARADEVESLKTAVLQANGIADRVVDGLWAETDVYWHHGDYSRIIALIRICVSVDPSFTEAYSDGAWLIWSMGDIPAADALLADGIARSPNQADLNYEFGFHLFHTQRYADALPYLQRAAAIPHPDRLSLTTLAHCYRYLGRYDDSIKTWHTVITDFPKFGAGPPNLARVEAMKRNPPATPTKTP